MDTTRREIHRREMLTGIAALTTAGAAGGTATADVINGTLAPGLSAFPALPAGNMPPMPKRRLSIRQLTPEEINKRHLFQQAAERAAMEYQAYLKLLQDRYDPGEGFYVHFEEDYVMIRDYRDQADDKKRAILREIAAMGR